MEISFTYKNVYRLDKEVQNMLVEVNLRPRFVNCVIMVDTFIVQIIPSPPAQAGMGTESETRRRLQFHPRLSTTYYLFPFFYLQEAASFIKFG